MEKLACVALVVVFAAGCASAPDKIGATYTSPLQYQAYDCQQIAAELARVNSRISELEGRLKKRADDDGAKAFVWRRAFLADFVCAGWQRSRSPGICPIERRTRGIGEDGNPERMFAGTRSTPVSVLLFWRPVAIPISTRRIRNCPPDAPKSPLIRLTYKETTGVCNSRSSNSAEFDAMKRILLEFIGGPWDGMNLCNDSPDPLEAELAARHYLLSSYGARAPRLCFAPTTPYGHTTQTIANMWLHIARK